MQELEKQVEALRDELKETTWAARNYTNIKGPMLKYQQKYIGRSLDRAKYDIRKYR